MRRICAGLIKHFKRMAENQLLEIRAQHVMECHRYCKIQSMPSIWPRYGQRIATPIPIPVTKERDIIISRYLFNGNWGDLQWCNCAMCPQLLRDFPFETANAWPNIAE